MYDKEYDERLLRLNEQFLAEKQRSELLQSRIHRIELLKTFQVRYILKALRQRWKMRNFSVSANNFGRKNTEELDLDGLKLCVYTCLVGDYDTLKEPVVNESNIDYIAFTDQNIPRNSVWTKVDITSFPEYSTMERYRLNRLLKMLPYKYLQGYDYSMYIDASIQPMAYMEPLFVSMGNAGLGVHVHGFRDCIYDELKVVKYLGFVENDIVDRQIKEYRKFGFPHHFGLLENTIIIRKHSDIRVKKLMEDWWVEYCKYPTRDQLSLPFVVWQTEFDKNSICVLGSSVGSNPRFNWHPHANANKKRMDMRVNRK